MSFHLFSSLLETDRHEGIGTLRATLNAHGLYNTFHFVLRLSPEVHRRLAALPTGILQAKDVGPEEIQAFSTYLHETVHWWQHIGSTYGFLLSLSHAIETQAHYNHLKDLLGKGVFAKPIYALAEEHKHDRGGQGTFFWLLGGRHSRCPAGP